jgi:hypothetical protein
MCIPGEGLVVYRQVLIPQRSRQSSWSGVVTRRKLSSKNLERGYLSVCLNAALPSIEGIFGTHYVCIYWLNRATSSCKNELLPR